MSTTSQGSPARLPTLTSLRFVAALVVFVCHWHMYVDPKWGSEREYFAIGVVGVQFFFILSGFVLTWSHKDSDSPMPFYTRRLARLYPAYFLSLVVALVTERTVHTLPTFGQLWPSFAWLQSWSWDKYVRENVSPVSWTLSIEALFYVCFPFLVKHIVKLGSASSRRLIQCAAAFTIAVTLSAYVLFGDGPVVHWVVDIVPLARLSEFVLGCALAQWVKQGGRLHVRSDVIMAVSLGICLVAALVSPGLVRPLVLVPLCIAIVGAATSDLDGKRSLWTSKALVALGDWSYCIYLFHFTTLGFVAKHVGVDGGPGFFVQSLVLTILIAALVSRYIEKPLAKRFARLKVASPAS